MACGGLLEASNAAIAGIVFNFASPAIAQSMSEIRRRLAPAGRGHSMCPSVHARPSPSTSPKRWKINSDPALRGRRNRLRPAGAEDMPSPMRRMGRRGHRRDRPEQPFPVAQRYGKFFQIAVGQLGKHIAWPPLAHVGDEPTNMLRFHGRLNRRGPSFPPERDGAPINRRCAPSRRRLARRGSLGRAVAGGGDREWRRANLPWRRPGTASYVAARLPRISCLAGRERSTPSHGLPTTPAASPATQE
jgi:hypothetical protein